MTPQDHIKLNKAKCLWVCLFVSEIQGYWAAYAAKNGKAGGVRREVNQLIIEKNKLSLSLRTIQCKLGRCILENEINKIEEKIGKISASQNSDIVREAVKSLQTSGGSFSQLGMWKLKNLMCPKIEDPPPHGKKR